MDSSPIPSSDSSPVGGRGTSPGRRARSLLLGALYALLLLPLVLPFILFQRGRGHSAEARPKLSRGRRLLRAAVLLAYYPLLLILGGEGIVRLFTAGYVTWYSAADVIQRHRPHGRFVWSGNSGSVREYAVEVRQNSGGWHDVEHAVAKPPGTFRVVVVGDSYIDAWQVPLEKSFHRRLEAELAPISNVPVEVVAFGSSGTAQLWQIGTLEEDGFPYLPDLVVAEFLPLNDVRENHPLLTRKAWLFQTAWIDPFGTSWRHAPLRHSEFLAGLAGKVNSIGHSIEHWGLSGLEATHPDLQVYLRGWSDPSWDEAWRTTEGAVDRLRKLCAERGARFVLCGFSSNYEIDSVLRDRAPEHEWTARVPPPPGATWDMRWPSARMAAFCGRNGVPYLDLAPLLAEHQRRTGRRVNFAVDGHWTEEGHRKAAEAVCNFLRKEGMTPMTER